MATGQETIDQVAQLLQAGRLDIAEDACQRIIVRCPDLAVARHLLGLIYHRRGAYDDAVDHIERSIALESSPQAAWLFNLGVSYQAAGRLVGAIDAYCRAIAKDANYVSAHNNLGTCLLRRQRHGESVSSFRCAIAIDPRRADAHANLGVALMEVGDTVNAVPSLRRAIELVPNVADFHANLGNALRIEQRIEQAQACYHQALRLDADHAPAHLNLGILWRGQGDDRRALSYLHRAVELDGQSVDAHRALGVALKEMGRFDEGATSLENALRLRPDDPDTIAAHTALLEMRGDLESAYRALCPLVDGGHENVNVTVQFATVSRFAGRQDEAVAMISRLLGRSRLNDDQKLLLHFAAARLLDEAGQYDQAFVHFQKANTLKRRRFDPSKHAEFIHGLIAVFGADHMPCLPRSTVDSDRPIFIIGMPRSGTSLVEQILAAHGQVYGAGELNLIHQAANAMHKTVGAAQHYPRCVSALTVEHVESLARHYLGHLAKLAPMARYVTDKMPTNYLHLGLISMMFPSARVIHCVRAAHDTCLSCYFQNFTGQHAYAYDLAHLGFYYRQYDRLMKHWKQVIDLPMATVAYEQLVEQPQPTICKLLEFCGLEWDDRCLRFYEVDRHVATSSYAQVRQPIYRSSIGRWRRYERHVGTLVDALARQDRSDERAPRPGREAANFSEPLADVTTQLAAGNTDQQPRSGSLARMFTTAATLFNAGELDRAQTICQDIQLRQPEHGPTLQLLGQIEHRRGHFDAAINLIGRALNQDKMRATWHFNLAVASHAAGRLDEAAHAYQQTLALDPGHARAHNNFGAVLLRQQRFEEAVGWFQRALAIDEDYTDALANIGLAQLQQGRVDEALHHLRRAVELRDDVANYHCGLGNVWRSRNQLDRAIVCYERALVLTPGHAATHRNLGVVRNEQGKLMEAIEHYRAALCVDENCAEVHCSLGAALRRLGRFDEARTHLQRALELGGHEAETRAGLADLYDMEGRVNEAWKVLQPLVRAGSEDVNVAASLARLSPRIDRCDEAYARLQRVLGRKDLIDPQRVVLHFSAAKLLDSMGRYDEAFEHVSQANRRKPLRYKPASQTAYIEALMVTFNRQSMPQFPQAENRSARPVFVVGMPRSGTSLVEQILASHPQVFAGGELHEILNIVASLPKTLGVRPRYPIAARSLTDSYVNAIARRYLNHLDRLDHQARRVTDKMPPNFLHLGLISLLFPAARVIHCVRHPLDTCLSIYFQNFGGVYAYAYNLEHLGHYYRQYQRLMAHWATTPIVPLMELSYEDLVTKPDEHIAALLRFCGLPWDCRCVNFHGTERRVLTASYEQVRRPIYESSVARWRHYEKHLGPLRVALGM